MSDELTADTLAPGSDATTASPESTPAPIADSSDELNAIWEKLNPIRSDDGKFTSKAAPETEAAPEGKPNPGTQDAAKTETATTVKSMPASWAKDATETWNSLTPAAQDIILKREADAQKGVEKLQERYKPFDEVGKAFEPFNHILAREGLTQAQAVSQLLSVRQALQDRPAETIEWLAKQSGVDLSKFAPRQGGDENTVINNLQAEVSQLKAALQHRAQAEQQETLAKYQTEAQKFAADPANEHFETVKGTMAQLLQSGMAKDYADAYRQAVKLDDNVWQMEQAKQAKAAEEKRLNEAKARAADAKKASSVNVRTASVSGSTPKSIDDTLSEIASRLYAR